MLRLLLSKAQGCKDFWKTLKPCLVGIHWKALDEYSQMSTHVPGFEAPLHHFLLQKLATSSIRVKLTSLFFTERGGTASSTVMENFPPEELRKVKSHTFPLAMSGHKHWVLPFLQFLSRSHCSYLWLCFIWRLIFLCSFSELKFPFQICKNLKLFLKLIVHIFVGSHDHRKPT